MNNIVADAIDPGYDTTRIFKAMAKARRGENITIGVIGGSITQGSLASSVETRWANLMTDWWKTTFPQSTVTLVNAGWGGTGSDIGTHRVQGDLLQYNPDFVVIEFAVNDNMSATNYNIMMMEGLVRQILVADSLPGLMVLTLKQADGISAVASHKQVTDHYNIPLVNFAAMIDTAVANDGITLVSIYGDAILHPNDIGMAYIADFIKYELNNIYSVLPDDADIDTIDKTLPAPIITDIYAHTYKYSKTTLVPTSSKGWEVNANGWIGHNPDDEITFTVDGNSISILYTQYFTPNLGQAEVWVDDGAHLTLDGHFNENWGPATRFAMPGENLADGEHILHVKITGNNSAGSTGHDFQIISVQKAGNIESAAPIANAGDNIKCLTNETIQLIGEATDTDNDTIQSYTWSIVSKPAESVNAIVDENNDTASFIPDAEGYYMINLIVSDGHLNSVPYIKIIHAVATNVAPIANAGNDSTVYTKQFCTLNGSLSSDADNNPLFFFWRIISQPVGSAVILNLSNTATPNFRPREVGEYKIGLVVNDSLESSIEDELIITATDPVSDIQVNNSGNSNFSVYPNPANHMLNIQCNIEKPEKCELMVFDISGKIISKQALEFKSSGKQLISFTLDPEIYVKGLYTVVLFTNLNSYSDKFVIE